MNENLPLKAPAIKDWLRDAANRLTEAGIASARLDAEIILAHTLRRGRTYLHAHDTDLLSQRQSEIADARLQLRLDRTPIAYIVGHKEFYGRPFRVTPATLIPRPESEIIIEIIKSITEQTILPLAAHPFRRLVDVGTGSGCLGITAKLEVPELDVTLLDISRHALTVAEANARSLEAEVTILRSNLLAGFPLTADIIIANLPYVDPDWERSPETNFEPSLALFSADNGTELIKRLLSEAPLHLNRGGFLILEADPRQHDTITKAAKDSGFMITETKDFILAFQLRG